MDRDQVVTVNLPDGDGVATYEIALGRHIDTEVVDGTTIARATWIDAVAEGADEHEAARALLGKVGHALGAGPGSAAFERFADFIRANGRKLTEDDVLRRTTIRHAVTADEQYIVPVMEDAIVEPSGDVVVVRGFGLEARGGTAVDATAAFVDALRAAVGDASSPGELYEAFTVFARERGERVPYAFLAEERAQKQAYESSKDELVSIAPDDIAAESAGDIPLLVDFWAEWCGPCRAATPVLAELAELWDGRIRIRKVDVDACDGVGERYNFRGIPTMIMFRNGAEIHRVTGFGGREALVSELERHLA